MACLCKEPNGTVTCNCWSNPWLLQYSKNSQLLSASPNASLESRMTEATWTMRLSINKLLIGLMIIPNRQRKNRGSLLSSENLRKRDLHRAVNLPKTWVWKKKTLTASKPMPTPLMRTTTKERTPKMKRCSMKNRRVNWKVWSPLSITTNAPCSRLPCAWADTWSIKKKYQFSTLNCQPRSTPASGWRGP